MNYYTEAFDGQLDKIKIYQRYPLLKPFVGSDYGNNGPGILLIAGSHYLPTGDSIKHTKQEVEVAAETIIEFLHRIGFGNPLQPVELKADLLRPVGKRLIFPGFFVTIA